MDCLLQRRIGRGTETRNVFLRRQTHLVVGAPPYYTQGPATEGLTNAFRPNNGFCFVLFLSFGALKESLRH